MSFEADMQKVRSEIQDTIKSKDALIAGLKNELAVTQALHQRLLADMTRCADRLNHASSGTTNSSAARMLRLEYDHMAFVIKHHVQGFS
jgi:hypothetical protein